MSDRCQLSNNTEAYTAQYEKILSEMIENMSSVCFTDSISGAFINQMIPHHCAAIAMSENLLRYTVNIPLQNMALNIISSQKKSIASMSAICPKCRCLPNTGGELDSYWKNYECITHHMFREMKTACTDNCIDANFIREMMPHHQGAVSMSQNALNYSLCPALVPLLKEIIVSQKKEILEMWKMLSL